ncbi:Retinol dehydrogenase 14 [Halotydeus destructor]|nr:Retinol dehydrogenase 14 [Halotydeus destructor]
MPPIKGSIKGLMFVAEEWAGNVLNNLGLWKRPMADSDGRLDGQTVVLTGGDRGQGYEVAMELARRGARMVMGCRDTKRAADTVDQINALNNGSSATVHRLDLSSLWSVRQFVEAVLSEENRVDMVICNAGCLSIYRAKTADDIEWTFGVNYVSHFLLVMLLLERLKESPLGKVILVCSEGHIYVEKIHFEDLNLTKEFNIIKSYAQSKLALLLFGMELYRRLPPNVHVYMIDPGTVNTDIWKWLPSSLDRMPINTLYRAICDLFGKIVLRSPKEGAQTTIHCAVSPKMADESGVYVGNTERKYPEPVAMDPKVARRLWNVTCDMVGLPELKGRLQL